MTMIMIIFVQFLCKLSFILFVCLIWFFPSQSTIFQLCRDKSSWVEPVLSKDKIVIIYNTVHL